MEERTVNLLLALATGRVWQDGMGGFPRQLDMWDCEWFMDFIKDHVCDIINVAVEFDSNSGFELTSAHNYKSRYKFR